MFLKNSLRASPYTSHQILVILVIAFHFIGNRRYNSHVVCILALTASLKVWSFHNYSRYALHFHSNPNICGWVIRAIIISSGVGLDARKISLFNILVSTRCPTNLLI